MSTDRMDAVSVDVNRFQGVEQANSSDRQVQERKSAPEKKNIQQGTESEDAGRQISDKVIKDAIERANKAISGSGRAFKYSVHEKTKDIIVTVIDSETNEVVREIPPKKILDLVANLMEMAGIFVDERR